MSNIQATKTNNDRVLFAAVKKPQESTNVDLKLSKLDVFCPGFLRCRSQGVKKLNKSMKIINNFMSIDTIVQRVFELDRLKSVLMDEDQLVIFNNHHRPYFENYKEFSGDKNLYEESFKKVSLKHNISEIDKRLVGNH